LFAVCQNTTKLAAYNISNPSVIVAAGTQTTSNKPEMVQVVGRYAYVVSSNSGNALQVFDISNPTSIPAAVATVSLSASDFPEALFIQGHFAYISATNNNLLRVVDISN